MKKHFLSITLLFSLLIMLLYPLTLFAQEKEECTASGPLIEVKQVDAQKAIVVRFDVPTSEIGPAMRSPADRYKRHQLDKVDRNLMERQS